MGQSTSTSCRAGPSIFRTLVAFVVLSFLASLVVTGIRGRSTGVYMMDFFLGPQSGGRAGRGGLVEATGVEAELVDATLVEAELLGAVLLEVEGGGGITSAGTGPITLVGATPGYVDSGTPST